MTTNSINISPDQLPNLTAQLPAGTVSKWSDASYDPHTQTYTFSDAIAAVVNTAYQNLSNGVLVRLKDYLAAARYAKEVGGVTYNGAVYPTDRESQSKYVSAVVMAQLNPNITFNWKADDGSFTTLNAAQIVALATAAGTHVQTCFTAESTLLAQIDAGTVTTNAQIDTAFAAIA